MELTTKKLVIADAQLNTCDIKGTLTSAFFIYKD